MKISDDGKGYEVSISLDQALNTIGVLRAFKELGKNTLDRGEDRDKAVDLVECMQVAIDVMCLFIQDNFRDQV